METIILVSVLSTIGVVAVLLSVAVAFIRLKSKVDVNDMEKQINSIYLYMDELRRENKKHIDAVHHKQEFDNNNLHSIIETSRDNLYRFIDSRCDKLESKIKLLNLTEEVK